MSKQKLPEGWTEVELGNIKYFKILSSGINKFEGEKDYLSTESVQGTRIHKTERVITYSDRPSRANMQPVLNSVWFAKMQSTLKVYSFDKDNKDEIKKYILSTGFSGIKVNEELVSPKYLRLLLTSKDFNKLKDKLCTGSTQRGINNKFIEKIPLIIPPLTAQKKIFSILEKAEKAKEWRKEADELTNDFLKSVFLEMFGNKSKFEIKKLREVTVNLDSKRVPISQAERKKIQGDIPYYGACGIVDHINDFIFNEEILLMGEDGQNLVSKNKDMAFIVKGKSWVNNHAHVLKMKEKTNIQFLRFYLNSISYLNIISGSAQPKLTQKNLSDVKIPLPPIELQNKFASIVKEIEAMKGQQKQSKDQIDNLFNVLMQKAFKGELIR